MVESGVSGLFIGWPRGARVGSVLDGLAVVGSINSGLVCWMLEGLMVVGSGVAGTSIGLIVDAPLDGLGVVGSINGGVD